MADMNAVPPSRGGAGVLPYLGTQVGPIGTGVCGRTLVPKAASDRYTAQTAQACHNRCVAFDSQGNVAAALFHCSAAGLLDSYAP